MNSPQTPAPTATQLHELTACETARLIRLRQVCAQEVAQDHLKRLEAVNPAIHAIVEWRPDEVLERAKTIDESLTKGLPQGPLAGVPITIKVNVDQAGYATTNGLRSNRDMIAAFNNPVVDSLLAAGAVPLGRTNTPAFSYRWFTSNLLHGTTFNPHDKMLTPGGSSGGAGAATAAGIGCIGHGTDIAGSIRYPAYACGIHGLRPSFGRVAAYNASGKTDRPIGAQLMAVSGPLARCVPDLRLALQAMARPDARDPWYVPAPLTGPDIPRRAAMCLYPDGLRTDPILCEALLESARKLRDAGWVVDELEHLPPLRPALAIQIMLWMGDGYEGQVTAARNEGDPGAIAALAGQAELARNTGFSEFSRALTERATLARQWNLFMERYAVVLLPSSAELPFLNDLDLQGPDSYQRVWEAQLPMIALPVTGLPAVSLCTGFIGHTPMGIQLVAPRFREDLCLAAAEAIEERGPAIQAITPTFS